MFHTLFDVQDQNVANNSQVPKNKSKLFNKKSIKGSNQNYYGKGNQAYDLYNNNYNGNYSYNDNNVNEEDNNTKFQKAKNKVKLIVYKNGFILNNGQFRDKIIPKNKQFLEQVERGVIPHELAEEGISELGILLINRKNETYIQPKLKYNNSFGYFDFYKTLKNAGQNQYKKPKPKTNNIIPLGIPRINSSKNIQKFPKIIELNNDNQDASTQNTNEAKDNENNKKFIAFCGAGKLIRNISTAGLHVNKDIKTNIDVYQPVCKISIRLYNGEIAKCEFNYSQTLRDIYYHVRKISGSNNFYLLDGFPPRPLRDYDRTIYELRLQNSLLTQKIN